MNLFSKFFKLVAIGILGVLCGAVAVLAYRAVASNLASSFRATPTPVIAMPVRLIIPSIHVDAPIKPVGVDAKGNIGVTADAVHVAWYKRGPRPGMPGVAVIDGHLDTKNTPQAVFYNLDELKLGDAVDVQTADGTTIAFKVAGVKTIPYNAPTRELLVSSSSASSTPQLVLITCTGDWVSAKKIYNQRLVVMAMEEK